jgi:membrane protease subunit HflK
VIGDNAVDAVLTTGKLEIQTRIMDQVQEMANDYGMGLHIVAIQLKDVQPPAQVSDAFKDVATARGTAERFTAVAAEYSKSPAVTASRLHLEMIENVMGDIRLTVVAQDAGALTHYSLNGGTP